MNYIIHKSCGNQVYLNITSLIKLIHHFGISSNKLKVGVGKLIIENDRGSTTFYCLNCKKDVDDILGICLNCGGYHEISNLWTLSESGGMYCNECSKLMSETRRSLSSAISTMHL